MQKAHVQTYRNLVLAFIAFGAMMVLPCDALACGRRASDVLPTDDSPNDVGSVVPSEGPNCIPLPGETTATGSSSKCCDPSKEPGVGGNPLCFEGHTCCADGQWRCNNADGTPGCTVCSSTCGLSGATCSANSDCCSGACKGNHKCR